MQSNSIMNTSTSDAMPIFFPTRFSVFSLQRLTSVPLMTLVPLVHLSVSTGRKVIGAFEVVVVVVVVVVVGLVVVLVVVVGVVGVGVVVLVVVGAGTGLRVVVGG